MTEVEWLAAIEPCSMLEAIRTQANDRKLRLFAVACCWDHTHWLWEGKASAAAVTVALRHADGQATPAELQLAWEAVGSQLRFKLEGGEPAWDPIYYASSSDIAFAAEVCAYYSANRIGMLPEPHTDELAANVFATEADFQAHLLRDIFGNPFRPVAFDPTWRSETTIGLASAIYDDRAFERMPILADALQDAGCDHPDILTHCREPGTHVRGCWVVDLVLGKE